MPKRKRRVEFINWVRKGGRLVRMEEIGVQLSDEIFMFHENMVGLPNENLDIIEQSSETEIHCGAAAFQHSPLLNLPIEMLEFILQMEQTLMRHH